MLVSRDTGETWEAFGHLRDSTTWLIENTLCEVAGDGDADAEDVVANPAAATVAAGGRPPPSLVMLFRTGAGCVYRSMSTDRGRSWTAAAPTTLPNPNSKVGMTSAPVWLTTSAATATAPTTRLILAYNPSDTRRAPLHLATSDDGGGTWTDVAVLEADPAGNFAYPTPIAMRRRRRAAIDSEGGEERERERARGAPVPAGGGVEVKIGYSVWGEGICVASVLIPDS